jgi:putative transposase
MHAIDEIYTKYPFYGSRRIKDELQDEYDISTCRERVQRLMRLMGIEAIYPKHRTTVSNKNHCIYPYLLRNLEIVRPDQVWSTDITYIRLKGKFCYLTVIMDWFSRYVISWEIPDNMEADFCIRALKSALNKAYPEIHNSDQGSQYTSNDYIGVLKANDITISMDGRGRCFDNIFVERLWRSVKYENIYIKHYDNISEVRDYNGLSEYFPFYNNTRRHQGLSGYRPSEVYFGKS